MIALSSMIELNAGGARIIFVHGRRYGCVAGRLEISVICEAGFHAAGIDTFREVASIFEHRLH